MRSPRLLTCLSALLLVLSFPPWNFSYLIWIALIPWMIGLRSPSKTPVRDAFFQSVWLSLLMTIGGFYWVAFAIHRYGGLPLAVGFLGLFLFGLFNQIQFLVVGPLWVWFNRRQNARGTRTSPAPWWIAPLLFGSIYATIDALLPKLFLDSLGHSQWNVPWTRLWASVGSVSLITFAIVWINALWSVLEWRRWALGAALLAGLVGWGKGAYEGRKEDVARRARWISVGMIQANIGDFEKVAAYFGFHQGADKIVDTHFGLGEQLLKQESRPDVLIWPETAYPSAFHVPSNSTELARDQRVEQWVRRHRIPLWFGAYDHQGDKDFNSVYLLSPIAREPQLYTYHKHVLLPFGETIPGFSDGGIFRSWFPNMGFFGQGPGAQVYPFDLDVTGKQTKLVHVAPMICYEALVDTYGREGYRLGADLFLNVTNDSWFGNTSEPFLHMALTVFRSIETGVSQVRATNTGLTVAMDPTGDLLVQGPLFKEQAIKVQVPLYRPLKDGLFMQVGKSWVIGFFLLFTGFLGFFYVSQRTQAWLGRLKRVIKR